MTWQPLDEYGRPLVGWHWAIARHDQLRKEITERAERYAKQREAKCPSNA